MDVTDYLIVFMIFIWFALGFVAGYGVATHIQERYSVLRAQANISDLKSSILVGPGDEVYPGKIVHVAVIDSGDELLYMYSISYRDNSTEYIKTFLSRNDVFQVGDDVFVVLDASGNIVKIAKWRGEA